MIPNTILALWAARLARTGFAPRLRRVWVGGAKITGKKNPAEAGLGRGSKNRGQKKALPKQGLVERASLPLPIT